LKVPFGPTSSFFFSFLIFDEFVDADPFLGNPLIPGFLVKETSTSSTPGSGRPFLEGFFFFPPLITTCIDAFFVRRHLSIFYEMLLSWRVLFFTRPSLPLASASPLIKAAMGAFPPAHVFSPRQRITDYDLFPDRRFLCFWMSLLPWLVVFVPGGPGVPLTTDSKRVLVGDAVTAFLSPSVILTPIQLFLDKEATSP